MQASAPRRREARSCRRPSAAGPSAVRRPAPGPRAATSIAAAGADSGRMRPAAAARRPRPPPGAGRDTRGVGPGHHLALGVDHPVRRPGTARRPSVAGNHGDHQGVGQQADDLGRSDPARPSRRAAQGFQVDRRGSAVLLDAGAASRIVALRARRAPCTRTALALKPSAANRRARACRATMADGLGAVSAEQGHAQRRERTRRRRCARACGDRARRGGRRAAWPGRLGGRLGRARLRLDARGLGLRPGPWRWTPAPPRITAAMRPPPRST